MCACVCAFVYMCLLYPYYILPILTLLYYMSLSGGHMEWCYGRLQHTVKRNNYIIIIILNTLCIIK